MISEHQIHTYIAKKRLSGGCVAYLCGLYLIFGLFFRPILKIEFIDELFILGTFGYSFVRKGKKMLRIREVCVFFGVFFLYFLYSLVFGANPSVQGMIADMLQQMKPFLAFYSFLLLYDKPLTPSVSKKIAHLSLCLAVLSFFIILISKDVYFFYGHPAQFSGSMMCYGMVHYFCTKGKHKKITFLILLMGIIGGRSKLYGEVLLMGYVLFLMRKQLKFKFGTLVKGSIALVCIVFLAWEKISFYVFGSDSVETDSIARNVLYARMPEVLIDYAPLGSGYASYATWFSGEYYSPVYYNLGIENVWGITPDDFSFIGDTYYPSLAEFGFVGIILFIVFWVFRYRKCKSSPPHNYKMVLMIFIFIFIESVASASLVTALGVIPMLLLGINESEARLQVNSLRQL